MASTKRLLNFRINRINRINRIMYVIMLAVLKARAKFILLELNENGNFCAPRAALPYWHAARALDARVSLGK